MSYNKTIWLDRVVERPLTYEVQENEDGTITLIPQPGTIIEAGTPLNANNLNNIEDGIEQLDTDLSGHLSKTVSQVITLSRDVSLDGVQAVSIPFKAKSLICFAFLQGTMMHSMGMWAENGLARNVTYLSDQSPPKYNNSFYLIELNNGTSMAARCSVQNVTDSGFELNWSKQGSPTGTATLYILASTH